jgi:hypothetical protein
VACSRTHRIYRIISFFALSGAGGSRSPDISRSSISIARLTWEIGTSFAPPSNGLSRNAETRPLKLQVASFAAWRWTFWNKADSLQPVVLPHEI